MALKDFFSRISVQPGTLPKPGLYHFLRERDGGKSRAHLRIDPDGYGTLIVDAAQILHLNPTAAQMAYLSLNKIEPVSAAAILSREYRISRSDAERDYRAIAKQVDALAQPNGACPVCDMEIDVTAPFSHTPTAPYRMDIALTYRCQNNCAHCYNARPRNFPEQTLEYWQRVIDRLWEIGIPHIVFTGGEPTLYAGLPDLIRHAESKGIITGLNTNGRKLADTTYLHSLLDAGLDHVQITLESNDSAIHDRLTGANGAWSDTVAGIRNAIQTRLYVMTNTTLLRENSIRLAETLLFLESEKVPTIGLNALIYSGRGETVGTGLAEEELPGMLELARAHVARTGQRLIWYTPTEYCRLDPVQMELGVKGCTAALYNMCMEPDGAVLPCQSYYQPLGKLLGDSWESIWNHPLANALRERKEVPPECRACNLLAECGGGCPLARGQNRLGHSSPALEKHERQELIAGL